MNLFEGFADDVLHGITKSALDPFVVKKEITQEQEDVMTQAVVDAFQLFLAARKDAAGQ